MTATLVYHARHRKGPPRVETSTGAVTVPIGPVQISVTIPNRAFADCPIARHGDAADVGSYVTAPSLLNATRTPTSSSPSETPNTLESLRQELGADPRGLATALSDLGSPRVLAARYADEGERRPLWSIGIIVAAVALLVYWALFFSYTGGMLAAVDSTAPSRAHSYFLFIQVEAFSTPDAIGIGWTSEWAWLVVPATIIVVAFLTGARSWRAIRRHRSLA